MIEMLNIAATLDRQRFRRGEISKRLDKKGRLILEGNVPEGNQVRFGKPSFMSSDVPADKVYLKFRLRRHVGVSVEEKPNGVMIMIFPEDYSTPDRPRREDWDPLDAEAYWFNCSKADANSLVDACQPFIDAEKLGLEIEKDLFKACKTTGKLSIAEFVDNNLDRIRSAAMEPNLPKEDGVGLARWTLEGFITKGSLSGLYDEKRLEYTDRDLLVRQQRVVTVQMDFNLLVQQLGNKGVVLSSIKCPQCGAGSTVPESGSMLTCGSCGSAIHVTDVLENFKGLLE